MTQAKRIPATESVGQRFGRLVVASVAMRPQSGRFKAMATCHCDCGTAVVVRVESLRHSEHTRSCGCLSREATARAHRRHFGRGTPEYASWQAAKGRCLNPRNKSFRLYGERGIAMCDRWSGSFENFISDMGPRPQGTSLDRIDNNGNYEPGNCRWATPYEQQANVRKNVWLTMPDGRLVIMSEAARLAGVHATAVLYHVRRGDVSEWLASRLAMVAA